MPGGQGEKVSAPEPVSGGAAPSGPAHMETVYVFCLPKKPLCVAEPVCPELLTTNTWQPVLQMTSPLVNEQRMTDEALLL